MAHFSKEQRQDWEARTRDSPFNRWLGDQVNRPDGTLDIDRLHALAEQYGLDSRKRYGHLNPAQQRMNIGNRLRGLVPPSVYGTVDQKSAASAARRMNSPQGPAPAPRPLLSISTPGLMARYGQILDELLQRGVIRTRNSPVGDYAEHLFATCFGWQLEANSKSGYDAVDPAGTRYQVKCRRISDGGRGTRQLSIFRGLPDAKFDVLAAVLFDQRFRVERAALIPQEVVLDRSVSVQHVNGWRFSLEDGVWALPNVADVTEEMIDVESRM